MFFKNLRSKIMAKTAKHETVAKVLHLSPKAFVEKFRLGTIGRQTVELIIAGKKSNDEILSEVKKTHKGCTTTSACIAWYKSKARKVGAIA